MAASVPKLLVVGGNGFLGSAICKAAVTKGWEVSSMSSSGKPYTTPAGHSPAWSSKVQWAQANAFDPSTYQHLIKDRTSVVHTLGILLEDTGYKSSIRQGDLLGLAGSLIKSTNLGGGGNGNPLKSEGEKKRGYEGMNRDSAIKVLDTFLSTSSSSSAPISTPSSKAKQFIYISAADAFRPLIPSRYIETKREAELEIARRCQVYNDPERKNGQTEMVKPVIIRPGVMYHPHIRPLTTLPAFLIDLSSKLSLRSGIPNPFASKSPLHGALESMRTFPLHVDHVANSVLRCIEESRALGQEQEEGGGWGGARVVEVQQMREWAGLGGK
ncbi:mitochondrial protein [Kwoniella mangroviensis CBS 8886]|nr:mitochondrial protein [Kwoniella mangroviensis CBS 8886]